MPLTRLSPVGLTAMGQSIMTYTHLFGLRVCRYRPTYAAMRFQRARFRYTCMYYTVQRGLWLSWESIYAHHIPRVQGPLTTTNCVKMPYRTGVELFIAMNIE